MGSSCSSGDALSYGPWSSKGKIVAGAGHPPKLLDRLMSVPSPEAEPNVEAYARQILLSTSEPVAPLRISASPIFDVAAPNSRASPSRSSSFPSYLIPYNFCSLQILVHKCVAHDVHELLDFRSWHRFRHQVRGFTFVPTFFVTNFFWLGGSLYPQVLHVDVFLPCSAPCG